MACFHRRAPSPFSNLQLKQRLTISQIFTCYNEEPCCYNNCSTDLAGDLYKEHIRFTPEDLLPKCQIDNPSHLLLWQSLRYPSWTLRKQGPNSISLSSLSKCSELFRFCWRHRVASRFHWFRCQIHWNKSLCVEKKEWKRQALLLREKKCCITNGQVLGSENL